MAEAKRRSKVKKFIHMTDYSRVGSASRQNLFENALVQNGYEWGCTLNSGTVPPDGTMVFVRVGQNRGIDVIWGNQVIAYITDTRKDELTTILCNSSRAGGIVATTLSNHADKRFVITFAQSNR